MKPVDCCDSGGGGPTWAMQYMVTSARTADCRQMLLLLRQHIHPSAVTPMHCTRIIAHIFATDAPLNTPHLRRPHSCHLPRRTSSLLQAHQVCWWPRVSMQEAQQVSSGCLCPRVHLDRPASARLEHLAGKAAAAGQLHSAAAIHTATANSPSVQGKNIRVSVCQDGL